MTLLLSELAFFTSPRRHSRGERYFYFPFFPQLWFDKGFSCIAGLCYKVKGFFPSLKGRSLRLQVTLVAARRWNSLGQNCMLHKITGKKRNAGQHSNPLKRQKRMQQWPKVCMGIGDEVYCFSWSSTKYQCLTSLWNASVAIYLLNGHNFGFWFVCWDISPWSQIDSSSRCGFSYVLPWWPFSWWVWGS